MFGSRTRDSDAQLAVMDAVVFFLASMIVASVLFSYLERPGIQRTAEESGDSDAMLEVLLKASIGTTLSVALEHTLVIDGREEVGECLLAEIHALRHGATIATFQSLNAILGGLVLSICSPAFEPSLVVLCEGDSCPNPILEILNPRASPNVYASSTELTDPDGSIYLVELLLAPAALPELGQV